LCKFFFSDILPSLNQQEYFGKLEQIFEHLKRGDIYEVNFAMEYQVKDLMLEPLLFYELITRMSPTPQAGILKWAGKWLICASMERFLKKKGSALISQPIKGTISKNAQNELVRVIELFQSKKNRSENVMIVDLVRNDLSRCCKPGSVKVERLFQIQSYAYLHQMVSTIVGEINSNVKNFEIIQSIFPAGSMTGCPKVRAMQIIEELEPTGRGIYSGSIGYFHQGNFDLNVVIRSLVWDEENQIGSFHVGGAITLNSNAQEEYEECQVKAQGILKVLQNFKVTP